MRCPTTQILAVLFSILFFYASVQAADKIRIAIPNPAPPYLTFPLAQKKGFLEDEGFAAEILLMRPTVQIPALNNRPTAESIPFSPDRRRRFRCRSRPPDGRRPAHDARNARRLAHHLQQHLQEHDS